ncbi:flavin reductase family protein [Micromonospora sp. SH-82]|uniref:flavin reductase family protein n=1 Tax=Micromonospora sp. SH-82 TaxID=3132938 RepID=UPI003EB84166
MSLFRRHRRRIRAGTVTVAQTVEPLAPRTDPTGRQVRRRHPAVLRSTLRHPGAGELVPVDGDLFDRLLRQHTAPTSVVTTVARPTRHERGEVITAGFTTTSLTPVSLDPPLVSFTVGVGAPGAPVLSRAEHVVVHLLAPDQQDTAAALAAGVTDALPGPFGLPLLTGVPAHLLCRVVHRIPAGDSILVVAEPLALAARPTP